MPRLSVIMPARDARQTVHRAVRSTLHAMPADSELVVLDDASGDGTAESLGRIRDKRLRIERSAAQLGVAGALTALLDRTDSEFVARMDADDESLPGRFRAELAAIRHADVVFSTVLVRRNGRVALGANPAPIPGDEFPFRLLLGNPVAHPTLLARREAIQRAGGYRVVPAEDYDLWLRMATSDVRMRRIALPTLVYRFHSAQQTLAPGWRDASWRDAATSEAFGDLSRALLGEAHPRLTTLSLVDDDTTFEHHVRRFGWAFEAAVVRRFGERASAGLRRRLRERLDGARESRRRDRVAS